jgi:hypothetical protein
LKKAVLITLSSIVGLVAVLLIGVAVGRSTASTQHASTHASTTHVSANLEKYVLDSPAKVARAEVLDFNTHPTFASAMCREYFYDVNLGWTDGAIFQSQDDHGAFDVYDPPYRHAAFRTMVHYCYWHHR